MRPDAAIVTFSHLRWDFVYQRPQHLMSRLAAARPVFFIEEPVYDPAPEAFWERRAVAADVVVCRPHTPVEGQGFDDRQIEALLPLMRRLADEEHLLDAIAWLYTPMALPLARAIEPRIVVYDCMDELSMFLGAPASLLQREQELIERADIMFTGGPSLFRAKQSRHPNVHCFASSVDADHFRQAGHRDEPADQAPIPHPRFGFYGVIDERIDLPLLDALGAAHPEWHVVMVGPVVKIDPATLPRRPNIHYIDQRSYGELPAYLGGWDVCILPFAQNDATRFISPTKTLEYMAAERPIVSTPIRDVAEPYGDIVYLGGTPAEFVAACEAALTAPEPERACRTAGMRQVIANTSWDATVAAMESAIAAALTDYERTKVPDATTAFANN